MTDEFIRLQAEENGNIYPEGLVEELAEEENDIRLVPNVNKIERIDEYWGIS